MSLQIIRIAVIIIFFLSFYNGVIAQQNTGAEVPGKIDSVPSSTNIKGSKAAEDSLTTYVPSAYPGGNKAFTRYLIQNIRMPQYDTKIDVSILVTFTIEGSGKLKNFQASDGPKPLQKEAIRVIKDSGRWIPAYKDGVPVPSEQHQKISFKANL